MRATDKPNRVNEEWKRFLNTSSIRGFKRCLENSGWLSIFWILFLFSCAFLMFFQCYKLIENYIDLKDAKLTRLKTNVMEQEAFPSVSLCFPQNYKTNMSKILANHSFTSPGDYSSFLRLVANRLAAGNKSLDYMIKTILAYDRDTGFHAQIPYYLIDKLQVPVEDRTVLLAIYFKNDTFETITINPLLLSSHTLSNNSILTPIVKISTFPHPKYMLCYTLEFVISKEYNKEIESMLLFLKLPELTNNNAELNAFVMDAVYQSNRVKIALHEKKAYPKHFIDKKSFSVAPGKLTEVFFDTTVSKKLDCRNDLVNFGYLGDFKYSRASCLWLVVNDLYMKHCNCSKEHYLFRNYDNCQKLNLSDPISSMNKYFKCYKNVYNLYSKSNKAVECQYPSCSSVDYSAHTQEHDWNINSYKWYWLLQIMVDFGKNNVEYFTTNQTGNLSNPQIDFSKKDTLATVAITRAGEGYVIQEEEHITSLSSVFSSVGGACSLCMGVTITFFGELFEFIYRMFPKKKPNTLHITVEPADKTDLNGLQNGSENVKQ